MQPETTEKIGLILMRSQPFHKGHVQAIFSGISECDKVIVAFLNYDQMYFNFMVNNACVQSIVSPYNPKIKCFGVKYSDSITSEKNMIQYVLDELKIANYDKPTHFITAYDIAINDVTDNGLELLKIDYNSKYNSDTIWESFNNDTEFWKTTIPRPCKKIIIPYILKKMKGE